MLVELVIENLALIERASLSLGAGLNVITGETGAGKSLLIDALELLMGQRARAALVRKGADKARVEGRFLVERDGVGGLVAAWLEEHLPQVLEECEAEGGGEELELILTRTLGRNGKSAAHVNHRPVTQRILRELAAKLVEIHGQNDHQKLFEPAEQIRLLDTFGELDDALAGYRERRAGWLALADELERLESGEAERLQRLDLLRFQLGELSDADPSVAERDALVAERAVLRNAEELLRTIGGLAAELAQSDRAVLDTLRRAERVVDGWRERVEGLAGAGDALRESALHLEDAAGALASFVDGVEANPARLEEVEARLADFEHLERKYRTNMAGLELRVTAIGTELEELESATEGADELVEETRVARDAVAESARRLSRSRKALRGRLRKAVEQGLAQLGLARATFEVAVVQPAGGAADSAAQGTDRGRFGPNGVDAVEFLLAANPGESREPLRRVASGGEVARIMLALRGALAVRRSTPTLVFDEIDSGVGGRLGPEVGAHLAMLADHHQILCVTHLPAIAARAHRHLRVRKAVSGGRTRTSVDDLSGDLRVEEIADMISGGAAHPTARAEARRLLEVGSRVRDLEA